MLVIQVRGTHTQTNTIFYAVMYTILINWKISTIKSQIFFNHDVLSSNANEIAIWHANQLFYAPLFSRIWPGGLDNIVSYVVSQTERFSE